MVPVSSYIRKQITSLLADQTSGFNATLAEISHDSGTKPFSIDFVSSFSKSFFQGYYGYNDLTETTNFKCPLMLLYTTKTANNDSTKFLTFAGSSQIVIDTYTSFAKSGAISDTESQMDVVEETFYNLFNSASSSPFFGRVLYNGNIKCDRGPLTLRDSNWLQLIRTTIEVDLLSEV